MDTRAGDTHELDDRLQRDGLRDDRDGGKAQARGDFALVRDASGRERRILGAKPDGVAESRGIAHRLEERAQLGQRRVGLEESDAAGFRELGHLREPHALEADRQRAQGMDIRPVEARGTALEHLHEARFVEHRVGVGRTDDAGHPTGHRRNPQHRRQGHGADVPAGHYRGRAVDQDDGQPGIAAGAAGGFTAGGTPSFACSFCRAMPLRSCSSISAFCAATLRTKKPFSP